MSRNPNRQAMSSHPAFRWAVGLWFGALLGAGLFVMPETVHGSIRTALGLDALLPAGVVSKAALAAGAGVLGLLLGLVIATRVAALNNMPPQEDEPDQMLDEGWHDDAAPEAEPLLDDEPRRPFNPREYFGEDDLPSDEPELPGELTEVEVEYADYEPVSAAAEPEEAVAESLIDAAPEASPVLAADEPLGDLPLSALTERLQRALDASRAAAAAPATTDDGELDPVIAFLRREADRTTPGTAPEGGGDAQAALRSALDRLSQVGKPQ